MMDEDVEMIHVVGEDDSIWLRRAIRMQNRCFAFAAIGLVGLSIVYAAEGFYASKSENPIIDYDAQTGEVGNDATNSKIQEALDNTKHKSGNAASNWWKEHNANGGNPDDLHDWYPYKNSSHNAKAWAAAKERWNRTHPNVPFPYNRTKYRPQSKPNDSAASSKNHSNMNFDYSAWLEADVTTQSGIMYEVVGQLSHDTKAFTEGLTFTPREGSVGTLYESTGLNGQSSVRILDPVTGKMQKIVKMDSKYFGEGLTYYKGKLIQITWRSKTGFIYNASDLTIPPETFEFTTTKEEGWGLTYDQTSDELIVSDGSHYLHFWDPSTFKELRKVEVTRKSGEPATNMNELEFWRGRVLANVWYQDTILVINPESGVVEKEYDFSGLRQKYKPGSDVLNGISVSDDPNVLFITGKLWPQLFRVKLLP